jgi:hypothetical protein
VLAVLMAGLLASCADALGPDRKVDTADQSVEVVPSFQVTGTAKLPDRLVIDQLGLAISSIELTPIESSERGIAYATGDPIRVNFDVNSGERLAESRKLVLPEAGTYDVSVRLEPLEGMAAKPFSLRMSGHVAGEAVDPEIELKGLNAGQYMEGKPAPLPLDDDGDTDSAETKERGLTDKSEQPRQWTPFAFHSERSVEHRLNRVELKPGQQHLRFRVDVHDWALELVNPVMQAVEQGSKDSTDQSIDASRQISSRGEGPAGVGEHMSVSIRRAGF